MKPFFLALLLAVAAAVQADELPHIRVSDNHRFLQTDEGRPFFYLADTAWELFHRLDRDEADFYLRDRAGKGFTAIQAVAIAELDGISTPNAYGHLPFVDQDPTRPAVNEGPCNDYWDHVDYIVHRANELGLYIGMLPTWGRYWHDGDRPVFNPDNARRYGRWLAERYRDDRIIWILGGDRNADNDSYKTVIRAMAKGLQEGDGGQHLITYHPGGAWGSADFFHGDEWLSFNMRENGHNTIYQVYANTQRQYRYEPAKPIIDGEPLYEDHPVAFDPDHRGHSVAADVRRPLYWDLFEGACGHTYGYHSIWQMYDPAKRDPVNRPLMSWREALQQPGASQMQYAKRLLMSRPYFTRIPATESVLVGGEYESVMPGEGIYHFAATMDSDGTYLMVYAPVGRRFEVNTTLIRGSKLAGWWYNPRNGKSQKIAHVEKGERVSFISPSPGEEVDWVLIVDDAGKKYKRP